MEKKIYNKLVRDKVPELLDKKKISYKMRRASNEEYAQKLAEKLVEEAKEFKEGKDPNELFDVLEVIEEIKKLYGLKTVELELGRIHKKDERGGFDKRIILEYTEDIDTE